MIKINSKNIAIGKILICKKNMSFFLTKNIGYEIVHIGSKDIQIMDDDRDESSPLVLSMDSKEPLNIYKYFKIWDSEVIKRKRKSKEF